MLVKSGTLNVGDIIVVGSESGKVRALLNDAGSRIMSAGPSFPVEVLGLSGTPNAGDLAHVVETEARAREIAEYRARKYRDKEVTLTARGSVEQMLADIQAGEASEVPKARDLSTRDGVEIRYHSIIYELIEDAKLALTGMLDPDLQETFIGYAEIKKVFSVTKVGKIAGCFVTEGIVKRGCSFRLLRDNTVIHQGMLKTLRRFKDEVKEVREGIECGMGFENYNDIQDGDIMECFEVKEVARSLESIDKKVG
jgi:translation initiation factor IF-2